MYGGRIWTVNDAVVGGAQRVRRISISVYPATNLFQLGRLALAEVKTAEVPVAWLDVAAGTLDVLAQRYERGSVATYWYEAPRFGYAALLEVNSVGLVRRYPDLWEFEADLV